MYIWKLKKFHYKNKIFWEGDTCDNIYLIKQGSVCIFKAKEKFKKDYHKNNPTQLDDLIPNLNQLDKNAKCKDKFWEPRDKIVGIVNEFNYIGETDFLEHRQTRTHSCISDANHTQVFCASSYDFRCSEVYLKKYFRNLRQLTKSKMSYRQKRYQEIKDLPTLSKEAQEKREEEIHKIEKERNIEPQKSEVFKSLAKDASKKSFNKLVEAVQIDTANKYHPNLYKDLMNQKKETMHQMMLDPINVDCGVKEADKNTVRRAKVFYVHKNTTHRPKTNYLDQFNQSGFLEKFKDTFSGYRDGKLSLNSMVKSKRPGTNKTFLTQQKSIEENAFENYSECKSYNPCPTPNSRRITSGLDNTGTFVKRAHSLDADNKALHKMQTLDDYFNNKYFDTRDVRGRNLLSRAMKGTPTNTNMVLTHKYRGYKKKKSTIFDQIESMVFNQEEKKQKQVYKDFYNMNENGPDFKL